LGGKLLAALLFTMTPQNSFSENSNIDVFCEIVQRSAPAFIIAENKNAIAFLDHRPATRGHTLIVPKMHFDTIEYFDVSQSADLLSLVKEVGFAVRALESYDAIIIHSVNGDKVQDVLHFHIHVYGKNYGQDENYHAQFKDGNALENELANTANLLRGNLSANVSVDK
jgi:histidine triad (HIT) family protein